jgi:heptosyltransferase-2
VDKEITFALKAPNWLGDAVMSLPAISAVVDCSRRGRVLVLASSSSAPLFSRLEGTLAYGVARAGGGLPASLGSMVEGASLLRKFKPVMVFSFTRSLTSALTCYLGRVERRIGFDDSAGAFLYTDRIRRPGRGSAHLIDMFNTLVESIGMTVDSRIPRIEPLASDLEAGRTLLKEHGLGESRYICFFPGARYGPAKMWPAGRFGLLGDLIVDKFRHDVVLLGGPRERSACRAVESAMSRPARNLCGKTSLGALMGLLRLSSGVVSNDSGGMHLSAAVGAPVVGLFFSTDPAWTGPVSEKAVALYKGFDCSPCFERDCRKGNACTGTISEDEVLEALAGVARLGN